MSDWRLLDRCVFEEASRPRIFDEDAGTWRGAWWVASRHLFWVQLARWTGGWAKSTHQPDGTMIVISWPRFLWLRWQVTRERRRRRIPRAQVVV